MNETEELPYDWMAVYQELFPKRPATRMEFSESTLALAVLMRREIRMMQPPRKKSVFKKMFSYTGKSE